MLKLILLILSLLLHGNTQADGNPMRFIYPPGESVGDVRHQYFWQLLDAVLASNTDKYGAYLLQAYDGVLPFQRAAAEVESGTGLVNIIARTSNPVLEKRLLPISLPLDKGLVGLRLFLVMPPTQGRLNLIKTQAELAEFSIGQGANWGDLHILRQSGFNKLRLADNYRSLFQMLAAGRFDLFPRGLSEIEAELLAHKAEFPDLMIERRFALRYPIAFIFYVPRTPEGQAMAERITDGLWRLQKNGNFERLYANYKASVLKNIQLAGRTVFVLPNSMTLPALPALTDKAWWDGLGPLLAVPR